MLQMSVTYCQNIWSVEPGWEIFILFFTISIAAAAEGPTFVCMNWLLQDGLWLFTNLTALQGK